MGARDWLNKFKKKTEESLEDGKDPEKRVENARKAGEWAVRAGKVFKKTKDTSEAAKEKIIDLTEKAEPIADEIDKKTEKTAKNAKSILSRQKDKLTDNFNTRKEAWDKSREEKRQVKEAQSEEQKRVKAEKEAKKESRRKEIEARRKNRSSTGSSILDAISPAVPKDKNEVKKEPKPPKGPTNG